MSEHAIRLYNVPSTKTESELVEEFRNMELDFSTVTFSELAGFALIEFQCDKDVESFCKHFPRLRKNISVYKEPTEKN